MVEAATSSSFYAVVASWLTPSCLFIFINLVIGTIAVTSRFATNQRKQQRGDDTPGQLARSPSLLDRVMSFNLGHYKYKYQYQSQTESEFNPDSVQKSDSPRLVRDESLLDRVRSFKLGLCKTEKQEDPCPNPDDDPTRGELTRRPSLLERLRSMEFCRSGSIKRETEESETEPEVSGNGLGQGQRERYSRKWEGEDEEEEGVDKKADDFINRFRQQLRLQRLDSILRYRDMLKGN